VFWAVLGIHDILGLIRIRDPCFKLMDLDPDSDLDTDPAIFIIDLQDASKKLIFNTIFCCLLLFEDTLFFKDKKSKRVTK
jgi:hypothetical protein